VQRQAGNCAGALCRSLDRCAQAARAAREEQRAPVVGVKRPRQSILRKGLVVAELDTDPAVDACVVGSHLVGGRLDLPEVAVISVFDPHSDREARVIRRLGPSGVRID
jgi:hypothetical protein